MNLFARALTKIFQSGNQQEITKIKPILNAINEREKVMSGLKDGDFFEKTLKFKKSIKDGQKLEEILPDSFALVREAAKRTLGERHYDMQLLGGLILHDGKIAEMKTGEGKTLVSTLPAYLNSLTGK